MKEKGPWGLFLAIRGDFMGIKLIATDMDGTFLDDEKNIPEENLKALLECADRGIEIVPATGRTVRGLPEEIKALPGVRYAITTNGAVVADLKEGKEVNTCRIPTELAVKVMTMARESQDDIMYDAYIEGIAYTTEYFYTNTEKYVPTKGLVALVRKTRQVVPDNIAYVGAQGKEIDKINMYFLDMDAKQRMREALAAVPGILVSSSIPNNLEINAAGADKGSALVRLASYLGIKQEETMAFGDGENDFSMIRMAGIGVAMENGEESVKAAADHVTVTNNKAGVAAAIRQFVLK